MLFVCQSGGFCNGCHERQLGSLAENVQLVPNDSLAQNIETGFVMKTCSAFKGIMTKKILVTDHPPLSDIRA
jgi:hypothetical protein